MGRAIGVVLWGLVCGACAGRGLQAPSGAWGTTSDVAWEARTSVQAGPTRGFLQVPKGGQPGTTSPRRPSTSEIGARTGYRPVVDVKASWQRNQLHVGGAWLFLHGQGTLDRDLTTHDDPYPVGTRLTSQSGMHEAWLGYRRLVDVGDRVTIAPGLGLYAWGLHYSVRGSNGELSVRDFSTWSPMLEAELAWDPPGPLRLVGEVRGVWDDALGLAKPLNALDAALRLHADLWPCGGLFAEVGTYRVEFHDHQPVPNHVEVEFAPYLGIGGQVRF